MHNVICGAAALEQRTGGKQEANRDEERREEEKTRQGASRMAMQRNDNNRNPKHEHICVCEYVYRQFRHFALLAESGFGLMPTSHNRTRGLPRPGERMKCVEINKGNRCTM